MSRFDKVTRSVHGLADALQRAGDSAKAAGGRAGGLDPQAVAEALLKMDDSSLRQVANRIGAQISKTIRGRGQIDFRRTS